MTTLFLVIKKAFLLFISLFISTLTILPMVLDLKMVYDDTNYRIYHGISPSITGVLLFITGVIFIIILMKKNKEEKINQ